MGSQARNQDQVSSASATRQKQIARRQKQIAKAKANRPRQKNKRLCTRGRAEKGGTDSRLSANDRRGPAPPNNIGRKRNTEFKKQKQLKTQKQLTTQKQLETKKQTVQRRLFVKNKIAGSSGATPAPSQQQSDDLEWRRVAPMLQRRSKKPRAKIKTKIDGESRWVQ
jgi:hypothetical protein